MINKQRHSKISTTPIREVDFMPLYRNHVSQNDAMRRLFSVQRGVFDVDLLMSKPGTSTARPKIILIKIDNIK